MTINQLLNKARINAVEVTNRYYNEICDGENVEEEIMFDKISGEYYKDLERFTMDNIYKLIRAIRKTTLMNDQEKERAINEIHNCPEYRKTEKEVAEIFINHFKRNIALYKTL